jgi:hypothetical protein
MFRPLSGSSSGIHLKVKITNSVTVTCYKMCKNSLCSSLVVYFFILEILKTLKLVKYKREQM